MKKEVIRLLKLGHNFAQPHCQNDNAESHTDLRYETLPHPPYSLDLSPTRYHFFKHLNTELI